MPRVLFRAGTAIGIPSSRRGGARRQGYRLYRVYNFGSGLELYRLQGPLKERLDLDPEVYAAASGPGYELPGRSLRGGVRSAGRGALERKSP